MNHEVIAEPEYSTPIASGELSSKFSEDIGAVVLGSTTEVVEQWQDVQFEFSDRNIIGNGVIAANRLSRVRSVIHTVAERFPDAIEKHEDEPVIDALKSVNHYMRTAIVINGKKITRNKALPTSTALKQIETRLSNVNHPLFQATEQIKKQYVEQLSPAEIDELCSDILLVGQKHSIVAMYKQTVEQLKQQSRHS